MLSPDVLWEVASYICSIEPRRRLRALRLILFVRYIC
jgi:hypothetical protein